MSGNCIGSHESLSRQCKLEFSPPRPEIFLLVCQVASYDVAYLPNAQEPCDQLAVTGQYSLTPFLSAVYEETVPRGV